mgnify:CR=1 FL=1
MSVKEKIIEGKYNYFNQGHLYSDEQFEIYRLASPVGNLLFSSEVTSRVKTGEFLKINIDYEVNFKFDPINVKIKRQLGNRSSSESFNIDLKETNVVYEFQGSGRPNYFEKIVRRRFRYLPSPSHLDEIEFIMSSSTPRTKLEPDPCPFFEILISLKESEYKKLNQLPVDVSFKLSCQVR